MYSKKLYWNESQLFQFCCRYWRTCCILCGHRFPKNLAFYYLLENFGCWRILMYDDEKPIKKWKAHQNILTNFNFFLSTFLVLSLLNFFYAVLQISKLKWSVFRSREGNKTVLNLKIFTHFSVAASSISICSSYSWSFLAGALRKILPYSVLFVENQCRFKIVYFSCSPSMYIDDFNQRKTTMNVASNEWFWKRWRFAWTIQ